MILPLITDVLCFSLSHSQTEQGSGENTTLLRPEPILSVDDVEQPSLLMHFAQSYVLCGCAICALF